MLPTRSAVHVCHYFRGFLQSKIHWLAQTHHATLSHLPRAKCNLFLVRGCLVLIVSETSALVAVPVSDASSLREIGHLRVRAWATDGPLPAIIKKDRDSGLDEHDAHTLQLVCLSEGTVIAAARLCVHEHFAELPDGQSIEECDGLVTDCARN
jgi:hypothetical protein